MQVKPLIVGPTKGWVNQQLACVADPRTFAASTARPVASPRTRTPEDVARTQAHKAHRGSTQVTTPVPVTAFEVPKKKALLSETDRWLKLSAKVKPFLKGLEDYFASLFSPVIACECEALSYSSTYETVALTIPREILSLVKTKQKASVDVVPFKLQPQEKLSAFEVLDRCLALFRVIGGEKESMAAWVAAKGTVDLSHVAQLQFFYKYYLRLLNHWNHAHPTLGDGIPLSLQRNFLMTVSDRVACSLLGVVVNELEFLRLYLQGMDPTGSLSMQLLSEDKVFDSESSSLSNSTGSFRGSPMTKRGSSFRRGSPPMSAKESPISVTSTSGSSSPRLSADGVSPRPQSAIVSPIEKHRGVSPRPLSASGPIMSPTTVRAQIPQMSHVPQVSSASEKLAVLQAVYANEKSKEQFLEFAKTKYAEENVLFLCDIVAIREAPVAERAALHAQLMEEFVGSSSDREVNLSSKARKNLMSATELSDLSCFDQAWKEVEHQVVQNLCGPYLTLLQQQRCNAAASSSPSPPGSARSLSGGTSSPEAQSPTYPLSPHSSSALSGPTSPLQSISPPQLSPARSAPDDGSDTLQLDLVALALDVKERVKSPGRRQSILTAFSSSGSPRQSAAASPPPPDAPISLSSSAKKLHVSSGGVPMTGVVGEMAGSALFAKRRATEQANSSGEPAAAAPPQPPQEAVPATKTSSKPLNRSISKPLPALPARTSYMIVVDDDENDFDASTSDL